MNESHNNQLQFGKITLDKVLTIACILRFREEKLTSGKINEYMNRLVVVSLKVRAVKIY